MAYTIKHMRLGEMFDQAIAIVRNNLVLLFSILLIVQIPLQLVQYLFFASIAPVIPPDATPQEVFRLLLDWLIAYWPWILVVTLLNMLLVYPIATVAIIEAIGSDYLGRPITVGEAIRRGVQKLGSFIKTMLLAGLCYAVGYCFCFLPIVIPLFFFALWHQVLVFENISGVSALRRSARLILQDWLLMVAFGFVLFLLSLLLNLGARFVTQPHLQVIIATFIQAGMTLVTTAFVTMYYFSSRCKLENFDLYFLAESIGSQRLEMEPDDARSSLP